jgi:hypothetical protein
MNIYEKLSEIQNELKCNKSQYNSFGKYHYRSCEDILEAVKPICKKYKATLVLSDEIKVVGDGQTYKVTEKDDGNETTTTKINDGQRFYIVAKATLYDQESSEIIENTAYAREDFEKKGMDGSQITGTASSYARKYALNGLFNIDDTKDADTDEYTKQQKVDYDKAISEKQANALKEAIENKKLQDVFVQDILTKYHYENIENIRIKDYANIVNELKKGIEE